MIRAARIGDTLHVRPALELLRRALPEARLTFLCSSYAEVVSQGLGLEAVLPYPHKGRKPRQLLERRARLRALTQERWDAVIGLEDKPWGRRLAARLGAPLYAESSWGTHIVERKAGVLVPLGLYDPERDGPPPTIRWSPSPAARDRARALLTGLAGPRVLLQIGSHAARAWRQRRRRDPLPEWGLALGSELARAGVGLVLQTGLGGGERRGAEELARGLEAAGAEVRLLAGLDLETLGAVLAEVSALVSPNTGPLHLAAAAGTRTLLLEGPSGEHTRPWRPLAPSAVASLALECSPCRGTAHGRACAVPRCLDELDPARVAEQVQDLLRRRAALRES